jgi:glutathione S-transferase
MSEAEPPDAPPTVRLYTQSLNPYTEKVAAALALKRLPFERVISDEPEDLQRWSPIARTLPVLEIDGRRMADSLEIVLWLDELFPEPPLYSPDPRIAETQRNLADWSDNSFIWYWNRWRTARYPQPGDQTPADASMLARIRGQIARTLGHTPTTRADLRELEIIRELQDRMDDLVGFLRDRDFFHADEPSIADLSVYAMLLVLREGSIPGCAEAIAERPTLAAFLDRMAGRIKSLESTSEQLP